MDSILGKYRPASLPLDKAAELGCLPDKLSPQQIASLWVGNNPNAFRPLHDAIVEAVRKGDLKGEYVPIRTRVVRSLYVEAMLGPAQEPDPIGYDILIHKDDFISWLEDINETIPADSKLARWLETEHQQDNKDVSLDRNKDKDPYRRAARAFAEAEWMDDPTITKVDMAKKVKDVIKAPVEFRTIQGWIADLNPNRHGGRRPGKTTINT